MYMFQYFFYMNSRNDFLVNKTKNHKTNSFGRNTRNNSIIVHYFCLFKSSNPDILDFQSIVFYFIIFHCSKDNKYITYLLNTKKNQKDNILFLYPNHTLYFKISIIYLYDPLNHSYSYKYSIGVFCHTIQYKILTPQ